MHPTVSMRFSIGIRFEISLTLLFCFSLLFSFSSLLNLSKQPPEITIGHLHHLHLFVDVVAHAMALLLDVSFLRVRELLLFQMQVWFPSTCPSLLFVFSSSNPCTRCALSFLCLLRSSLLSILFLLSLWAAFCCSILSCHIVLIVPFLLIHCTSIILFSWSTCGLGPCCSDWQCNRRLLCTLFWNGATTARRRTTTIFFDFLLIIICSSVQFFSFHCSCWIRSWSQSSAVRCCGVSAVQG